MSTPTLAPRQSQTRVKRKCYLTEKKTIRGSATETSRQVLDFWTGARVPTRLSKHVIDAVDKLYYAWQKLKKNQTIHPNDPTL